MFFDHLLRGMDDGPEKNNVGKQNLDPPLVKIQTINHERSHDDKAGIATKKKKFRALNPSDFESKKDEGEKSTSSCSQINGTSCNAMGGKRGTEQTQFNSSSQSNVGQMQMEMRQRSFSAGKWDGTRERKSEWNLKQSGSVSKLEFDYSDDSDDSVCLKIHGCGEFYDSSDSNDDGLSELDELYERMKPGPVEINPDIHHIVVIRAKENAAESFVSEILTSETNSAFLNSPHVTEIDKVEEQGIKTENNGLDCSVQDSPNCLCLVKTDDKSSQEFNEFEWTENLDTSDQSKKSVVLEVEAVDSTKKKKKRKKKNAGNIHKSVQQVVLGTAEDQQSKTKKEDDDGASSNNEKSPNSLNTKTQDPIVFKDCVDSDVRDVSKLEFNYSERMKPGLVEINPDIHHIVVRRAEENAAESLVSDKYETNPTLLNSLHEIKIDKTEEQKMKTEHRGLNSTVQDSSNCLRLVKTDDKSFNEIHEFEWTENLDTPNKSKKYVALEVEAAGKEEQTLKDQMINRRKDEEYALISSTLSLLETYCDSNNIFAMENGVGLLRIVQRIGIENFLRYMAIHLGCKDEATKLRFLSLISPSVVAETIKDDDCDESEIENIFQILNQFNQETSGSSSRKSLRNCFKENEDGECILSLAKRRMLDLFLDVRQDKEFCILIIVAIIIRWFLPAIFYMIVSFITVSGLIVIFL